MNKNEALEQFKGCILPHVFRVYGKNDKPAVRQAWNDFTDSLFKDGRITQKQCDSWLNPF